MASPLPDLKGFTILVIEDDPDGLQLLTTAMTACGARVLTASDTTIVRGHLDTVKLDLLVTDLGLPGETARRSYPGCARSRATRAAASRPSPSRATRRTSPRRASVGSLRTSRSRLIWRTCARRSGRSCAPCRGHHQREAATRTPSAVVAR